jgi:hypothetical protein
VLLLECRYDTTSISSALGALGSVVNYGRKTEPSKSKFIRVATAEL